MTIKGYETNGHHVIEVGDDGMGFYAREDGNRTHVGLNNVKERLEYMCGGSLHVESHEGKGTLAIVKIPKSRQGRAAL